MEKKMSWITKSGKKVSVKVTAIDETLMIGLSALVIDGKQYVNPRYLGATVEFSDKLGGQKLALTVPVEVQNEVSALSAEAARIGHEARVWAGEQSDKYEAHVRAVSHTMSN